MSENAKIPDRLMVLNDNEVNTALFIPEGNYVRFIIDIDEEARKALNLRINKRLKKAFRY